MSAAIDPAFVSLKGRAQFDFSLAVERVRQVFPRLDGILVFFKSDADRVFGNTALLERLSSATRKQFNTELLHYVRKLADGLGPSVTSFTKDIYLLNYVSGYYGDDCIFIREQNPLLVESMVFQHEVGHVLTGALPYREIADTALDTPETEVLADAFSAIENIREFGKAAYETFESYSLERAFPPLARGAVTHLTTCALDKVLLDAETADFVSLLPEERVALAKDYADQFTPPDQDVLALIEAFKPLKKRMYEISADNTGPLKELAAIITRPDINPYALYLGARILHEFMKEGGTEVRTWRYRGIIALAGSFWDEMKVSIGDALRLIPVCHVLRQLDLNKVDVLRRQEGPTGTLTVAPALPADLSAEALPANAAFALASADLDSMKEVERTLELLPAADFLEDIAAHGYAVNETNYIPESWIESFDRLGEEHAYYKSLKALTGRSASGMNMNIVMTAGAEGKECIFYILKENDSSKTLVIGDAPVSPQTERKMKLQGAVYVCRSDEKAGHNINGFLGSSKAYKTHGRACLEELVRAYACVNPVPPQFIDKNGRMSVVLHGLILAATERPYHYTSLMRPKRHSAGAPVLAPSSDSRPNR